MGTIELKKRKFSRFPIIFFIVTSPLLFILSFRVAFASFPTAHDDAYGTFEDTTLVITAPGVLGNDDDVDNGEAFLETAPLSGTVELSASGSFTYTPLLDFSGIITFSYYVSQTGSISDVANVVITVTAVNDPPLASSDNATTPEDTAVSIPVLANDNDVDGSLVPSSLTLISEPVSGTTSINPTNGNIIYTPTLNFNGSDSLIYQVFDNGTPTPTLPVTATVYLTVTAVNDAPTATNDSSTTTEDTAIYISQPGVLSNDNDVDSGDTITVADFDGTSSKGAVVSVSANGGYTYNPADSSVLNALAITETTIDTFSYIISDSGGLTDTAIVTVTVNGSNDAPVIDNSSNMTLANINEDDTVTIGTSVGVIISSAGGDRITDIDAGAVEGIAVVGATNINGIWQYSISDGSSWNSFGGLSDFNAVLLDITEYIRFVPNADYNGSAGTINFRAWDQTAGSSGNINVNVAANGGTTPFSADVETATLTVLSVNDAPVLDNSGAMYLTSIGEDNTTNPGDSVAAIVASPGGNRITDVDVGDEEGIAVIDVDNSHGIWQYSTNGGLNWASFFVSPTSATLLDSQSRIRFVPQANYFGNAGNITFRAWDLTSGIVGDTGANVSQNGGITAFSTVTETAALNVFSINDKPFLDLNGGGSGNTGFGASFTEDGGAVRIVDTDLSIEDVDDTNLESAQAILTNLLDDTAESLVVDTGTTEITAVYSSTTGILSLTGSASLANYQTVLRTLSYNNTSQDPNTDGRVVEVTVNDGSDNSNLTTSFVSINADNDYPILENNVTLPVNEGGTVTISVSRLPSTGLW